MKSRKKKHLTHENLKHRTLTDGQRTRIYKIQNILEYYERGILQQRTLKNRTPEN